MVGIFERKVSAAAIWCQRFAVFLVPYFIVVILLHRFDKISVMQLFSLIAIGFVIAVTALVLAIRALWELWSKGHRGGKATTRGLFLIILVLLPFGYQAYLALSFPLANDVSTSPLDPPEYLAAQQVRNANALEGMNPIIVYGDEYADELILAYPRIKPRLYPAGPERVLKAVRMIFEDNGWVVVASSGIPESTAEGEEELEDNTGSETGTDAEAGLEDPEDIFLETTVSTTFLALESDVIVRIVSQAEDTLVDVRSSSRWGAHDFGYNARLIRSFLEQLDTQLLGIAGEG